jgi:tetratricopeptide (TPR) repeat protein
MESLEYIDNYFNGEPGPAETARFEEKIISDSSFAEEVAHYLGVMQTAKEKSDADKKKRFRELYDQNKSVKRSGVVKKLWPSIAVAALVAGVIFGWYLFMQPVSTKQLADHYIQEHFQTLSVSMGKQDSMQSALNLFNNEKLTEALVYFQNIIQSDTSDYNAKKYAGIVSLRLQHYDKALDYFRQLGRYSLQSNPALLYQSITLMKRNRPGDAREAKELLQQIVQDDLEGKEVAQEWLKKL